MNVHRILILIMFFGIAKAETCINPVITAPPSIPPFILIDEDGNRSGIAFTYAIHKLKAVLGKPIIQRAAPPNRMIQDLKSGTADINVFEMFDPSHESYVRYTDPWTYTRAGILTRSDTPLSWEGVHSLDKLRGGYFNGRAIPEPYGSYMVNHPNVQKIPNPNSMLNMLIQRRVDYLFVLVDPITFDIQMSKDLKLTDFIFHKDSFIEVPIHMVVSKKSPCISQFELINNAIKAY